jgi:hypothetical protein
MKNITWKKTSILRPLEHGLVDYVATGFISRDKEEIPCEIGFTEFTDSIQPTHIFIKAGITASGHHYEDETIEL